jgi:FKBP-type peptidyl-prolyl cis-trans isomerase 2
MVKKSKEKEEAHAEHKSYESLKAKAEPLKSEKINKAAQMTEKKRIEMVKDSKKGIPITYAIAIVAVVAVIAGALIFMLPGYTRTGAGPVKSGDIVQILYTLTLSNGSVFDAGNFTFRVGGSEAIKGVDDAVIGMNVGEKKRIVVKPDEAYGYYDENKIFDIPLINNMNTTESTTVDAFNMTFGEMPVVNKTYTLEGMVWSMRVTSIQNGTVKVLHEPQNGMTFDLKDALGNVYGKGTVNVEGDRLIMTSYPIKGSTIVTVYGTGSVVDFNETSMKLDFNHPLASETLTFNITLLNYVPYSG